MLDDFNFIPHAACYVMLCRYPVRHAAHNVTLH